VFCSHALPQEWEAYERCGIPLGPSLWLVSIVKVGACGVDLFFVLSAYLITDLLFREQNRFGNISLGKFYIRRSLRIWPLYYGFTLMTAAGAGLSSTYLLAYLCFFGNWACVAHGYPQSAVATLWSVSVEEQFYVVWPLVLCSFRRATLVPVCFASLALSTIARIWLVEAGAAHPSIWCNSFARLDPIILGSLLAIYVKTKKPPKFSRTLIALGILSCILASRYCGYVDPDSLRYSGFAGPACLVFYPLIAMGTAAVVLGTLGLQSSSGLIFRIGVYCGKISYGLYVFHALALKLTGRLPLRGAKFIIAQSVLGLLLTLLMGTVSYELYEKQFLKLKTRFTRINSRPL
jgi:peptidoglycan/LPS O-acetylase OafA/YrhL